MQLSRACRMPKFAQRFGFDLADPFTGHFVLLAHFFERAHVAVHQAKAELQHFTLALGQAGQHIGQFVFQQVIARHFRGVFRRFVFDKIAKARIALVPDDSAPRREVLVGEDNQGTG